MAIKKQAQQRPQTVLVTGATGHLGSHLTQALVARLGIGKVPVIAMVSCNPVTFARDARSLCQAGYRLDWVPAIDQFRWSAHVELAARFVLTKA